MCNLNIIYLNEIIQTIHIILLYFQNNLDRSVQTIWSVQMTRLALISSAQTPANSILVVSIATALFKTIELFVLVRMDSLETLNNSVSKVRKKNNNVELHSHYKFLHSFLTRKVGNK